ncbi:MAG: 3-deoxy-8-phosphooctulonate synthase [Synergistaceae bacterium]|nr:3-deoxy-8-phosphooctulonate synthase [Synergistaceae bacterium]
MAENKMSGVKIVKVGNLPVGGDRLVVAAGPCVLESFDGALLIAEEMKKLCAEFEFGYIFKASFDKANRTSIKSYRGPGIEEGLSWLKEIGRRLDVPVVTDMHEPWQAEKLAGSVDLLQIPAFLCRQTDLLVAASSTGKPLNIKKAQFMAPEDMRSVVGKCREAGNDRIILCERGTAFGYHELTVDFRSIPVMRNLGYPVMFDATHSVQKPGGQGDRSGGDRSFVLPLIRAAVAVGIDALFMEVHPDPEAAKCDGPNMVPLGRMREVLRQAAEIDRIVRKSTGFASLAWAEE